MSTFGFYRDAPYKIINEGREITLKLQKTSPTTARITWTLPFGSPGCSIDDLEYNGIVIVVDNTPIKLKQTPSNGNFYTGDPTVNRNLHAGDKIDSGLVVGAFYDDKSTTTLDISNLEPNIPYYVAGFAVNNVGVYHREGVHSYSQDYQESGEPDTSACQLVELGVSLTDMTGLNPSSVYSFKVTLNGVEHTISVNGNTTTYQDLIRELNYIFANLENPYQGATPPSYGTLYVNQTTNEVFVWDGAKNVLQESITSNTTPTSPTSGDYWVDSDSSILYSWNGVSWIAQPSINFSSNPKNPECGTFWFNGTTAFVWDGNIWKPVSTYLQSTDPTSAPTLPCGMFWLNALTNEMYRWEVQDGSCVTGEAVTGKWVQVDVLVWSNDPRLINDGYYWFNATTNELKYRDLGMWVSPSTNVITSTTPPSSNYVVGTLWINPEEESLFEWNGVAWNEIYTFVFWFKDPTTPLAGDLYLNGYSDDLFAWDVVGQQWKQITLFTESNNDPSSVKTIEKTSFWADGTNFKEWDGMQWIDACTINFTSDPVTLSDGVHWYNTTNDEWYILTAGSWVTISYIKYPTSPSSITAGQYWYNPSTNGLFVWNGIVWVPLIFQTQPVGTFVGTLWYNTTNKTLYEWSGSEWVIKPTTSVSLDENGHFLFTTGSTGSSASISIVDDTTASSTGLFGALTPVGRIQVPKPGTDGLLPTPSYVQLGVGTDGTSEERREMIESILLQLGYPTVQVELTKQQLEFCVDQSLQTLRRMGSAGYERVYFFLNLKAGQQHYKLTDQTVGFHKIVDIMGIHRMTSAFLGTAEGQGVYGQLVLQHLYQMGTFDLVSYHIINEYVELMEKLFAANIMYTWREKPRQLSIHQNIWRNERVLVDAMIERTEQDILADRFLNNWLQTWATAEACMILSEVRGKFGTLPGAGGGVTLNSGDLRARAERGFQQCIDELDNYIANSNIEDLGMGTTFIMG